MVLRLFFIQPSFARSLSIKQDGVVATKASEMKESEIAVITLPDIVRILSVATRILRTTIAQVLKESKRLQCFANNSQAFIEEVQKIIKYH